eukprot:2950386-Pyramimonas_sp.AAC.1
MGTQSQAGEMVYTRARSESGLSRWYTSAPTPLWRNPAATSSQPVRLAVEAVVIPAQELPDVREAPPLGGQQVLVADLIPDVRAVEGGGNHHRLAQL